VTSCDRMCQSDAMCPTDADDRFLRAAYEQAVKSYNEGGLPIGAVMAENGVIIAAGHNRRLQEATRLPMAKWIVSEERGGELAMME
jgi:hypothetical protein